MADIKTKKVYNGFIRSMDKSIGASHRTRNAASDIKNMASRSSESDETDNATFFINPIKTRAVGATSSAIRKTRHRSYGAIKQRYQQRRDISTKDHSTRIRTYRQRRF